MSRWSGYRSRVIKALLRLKNELPLAEDEAKVERPLRQALKKWAAVLQECRPSEDMYQVPLLSRENAARLQSFDKALANISEVVQADLTLKSWDGLLEEVHSECQARLDMLLGIARLTRSQPDEIPLFTVRVAVARNTKKKKCVDSDAVGRAANLLITGLNALGIPAVGYHEGLRDVCALEGEVLLWRSDLQRVKIRPWLLGRDAQDQDEFALVFMGWMTCEVQLHLVPDSADEQSVLTLRHEWMDEEKPEIGEIDPAWENPDRAMRLAQEEMPVKWRYDFFHEHYHELLRFYGDVKAYVGPMLTCPNCGHPHQVISPPVSAIRKELRKLRGVGQEAKDPPTLTLTCLGCGNNPVTGLPHEWEDIPGNNRNALKTGGIALVLATLLIGCTGLLKVMLGSLSEDVLNVMVGAAALIGLVGLGMLLWGWLRGAMYNQQVDNANAQFQSPESAEKNERAMRKAKY